jgi:hypothetical protein
MDTKRAGLLLYSLQIASQNARNQNEIIGREKQVREVTRTEEGSDLGPETNSEETPATMPYGWLFQALKENHEAEKKEIVELHAKLNQPDLKPDPTGI